MNGVATQEQAGTDLIDQALAGNARAIARLITQVENNPGAAQAIISAIYPATGRAHLIGITGPPGSGKSTLVNELAKVMRQSGRLVAIVAVDPSSPFTGGAILGDRIRLRDLSGDTGIFVRSMASRGSLGGLARATSAAVKVLDAAGYDRVIIETVGAGQAEVSIAAVAHTTVVLEAPGMGDEVQSIKAGILEIADLLVVNKADQPGANRTAKTLEMMLHFGQPAANEGPLRWDVPVLQTVATTGQGVAELAAAVERHRDYLLAGTGWEEREAARARQEIDDLLRDSFLQLLASRVPAEERAALLAEVVERRLDPYSASELLLAQALGEGALRSIRQDER